MLKEVGLKLVFFSSKTRFYQAKVGVSEDFVAFVHGRPGQPQVSLVLEVVEAVLANLCCELTKVIKITIDIKKGVKRKITLDSFLISASSSACLLSFFLMRLTSPFRTLLSFLRAVYCKTTKGKEGVYTWKSVIKLLVLK